MREQPLVLNIMERVRAGERIDGWVYNYRDMGFGYWRESWEHNLQLIYEEEYNDYYGQLSTDHTIKKMWVEPYGGELNFPEDFEVEATDEPFVLNDNNLRAW